MTAQPTTAWGQTLKTASLMRQENRGNLSEPIPTFFHEKAMTESGSQSHILRSRETDDRGNAFTQESERALSPEFMRAITLTEFDEPSPAQAWREDGYLNEPRGLSLPRESQQGVMFNMNKFSLVALIVGLLLLGLMFFAGGLMLAFNFSSHETAAPQQTQQSHDHSGAATAGRALVTLLPSGAQNTVSQANQVGNVAQTVATAAPASVPPAQASAAAPAAVAPVAGVSPVQPGGQPAGPALLGPMPGARGAAAIPPTPSAAAPVTSPVVAAHPIAGSVASPGAAGSVAPPAAVLQAPAHPLAPAPAVAGAPGPVMPAHPGAPAALQPVPGTPSALSPSTPGASAPTAPLVTGPALGPAPAGRPIAAVQEPILDATALTRPFSLQVGAYGSLEGAQKVVTLLHRRGYNAYVVAMPLATPGKDFAVRMGGYYTRQAAMTAAEHLMRKERFKIMAITKNNAERVIL